MSSPFWALCGPPKAESVSSASQKSSSALPRFDKKVTLGGTSVRAAIAMRKLGISFGALHLITQNDHVRRLIPHDSPYVCSSERDSMYPHLDRAVRRGRPRERPAPSISARAKPNRLIYHCNADRIAMRIAPEFADLIGERESAAGIRLQRHAEQAAAA